MSEITRVLIARVGVDLAKRVIQVHADNQQRVLPPRHAPEDALTGQTGSR